ncbi:MAG: translation elongation factor Ts [Thermotogota bacterium]|nr:translation elongation factor Ts [Thermotogota bacterium]
MADITADMVKKLRDMTAAGMMDCKKALVETNGDYEKAKEFLRKKGITKAEKVAGRAATEGIIYSYIHHNDKVGVLLELNCNTDFVANTSEFKELAHKISLQIASMKPRWVKREDIPEEVIEKEREIYKEQMKESGKPDHIVKKIVDNKIEDFYQTNCLLEHEYVFEKGKSIKELIVELVSKTGENIEVGRFVRWEIGEE